MLLRSARRRREAAVTGERIRSLAGHDLACIGERARVDAEGEEAGRVVVAELGDRDRATRGADEAGVRGGAVALLAELGAEAGTARARGFGRRRAVLGHRIALVG